MQRELLEAKQKWGGQLQPFLAVAIYCDIVASAKFYFSLWSKRKLCSSATRAGAPKVLDEKVLERCSTKSKAWRVLVLCVSVRWPE